MSSGARAKRARTGLLAAPPSTLSGPSPLHLDCFSSRSTSPTTSASSVDPRAHGVVDRRFHPRRWTMITRRAYNDQSRRRLFLNVVTGELIHVRVPDLRSYHIYGTTAAEGLLVRAVYPHLDTQHDPGPGGLVLGRAGLAADSTLAILCKHNSNTLAIAKPGDKYWTRLGHGGDMIMAALPFAGRLYCVTYTSVLVMETTAADGGRQLSLVADHELDDGRFNQIHPVYDDDGGLVLVSRYSICLRANSEFHKISAYRAELDTGSFVQVCGLGGRALFVGAVRSQSVSVDARVSVSVSADTVYTCECDASRVLAFDLLGGGFSEANFDRRDIAHYLACVE
ncbi:unnamed protein product [Urochloa decumbens]|uniref:KIB1-4 beta-propeller domain-containing protein n=1 Tax=Urochloa decumbens TaxID=240449 RepID=A0ABC9G470_9POAL